MINELKYTPLVFDDITLLVLRDEGICLKMNSDRYRNYAESDLQRKLKLAVQRETIQKQPITYGMNTAYIFVTDSCNLSCEFCSMRSDQKERTTKFTMTEEMIKNRLIPLLKKIMPRKIIISGGEPLLHENIVSIITLLHENLEKSKIILQSNGTLLNDNFISAIKRMVFTIEISTSHYKDVSVLEKHIKFIIGNSIQITLSYVYEGDLNSLYNVIDLIAKYDLGFILNFVAPTGSALDKKCIILKSEDRLSVYRKIVEYILEKGYVDKQLSEIFTAPIVPSKPCGALGNTFAVFPNGKIYMCHSLKQEEYYIGDISTEDSSAILKQWRDLIQKEYIKKIFSLESLEMCEQCKFAPICGGICTGEKQIGRKPECLLRKIIFLYNILVYDNQADRICNLEGFLNFTNEDKTYEKFIG